MIKNGWISKNIFPSLVPSAQGDSTTIVHDTLRYICLILLLKIEKQIKRLHRLKRIVQHKINGPNFFLFLLLIVRF